MGTDALLIPFAVALLSTLLPAQARAPFSGTVRDEGGKLLANAEVTCVFVPDASASGAPDRVTEKADAEGRFRMELIPGHAYVVWAVGPAGAGGIRSFVRPGPDAAAGRTLDLVADERRGPMKLLVKGAAAWIADGPLSLRLFVGGRCALATDVVIPGDGAVNLPPLPSAQVSVVLQDGKGQPIQVSSCDLEAQPGVVFVEPREVPVTAHDADGKPLGGVQVLQLVGVPEAAIDRISEGHSLGAQNTRIAGVTGVDGQAVVRLAGDVTWLCGRLPGHGDCWSGWAHGARFQDGNAAPDEGPLVFVLRPAGPRQLRVVGLAKDDRVEVSFRGSASFQFRSSAGYMQYLLPGTTAVGDFQAEGARDGVQVFAKAQLVPAGVLPRRMIGVTYGKEASLPDVDVTGFRLLELKVLDGDRPVPCVRIGVTDAESGARGGWAERFVTDAEGRADLLMGATFDLAVYANTGKAHAVKVVTKTDPAGPVVLQLEPLATARLRIVDPEGRPVAGARLRYRGGSLGGRGKNAEAAARDHIAGVITGPSLSLLRSNAAGEIEVRFADRPGVATRFKAVVDTRESADITLRADDKVQEIVVR